MTLAEGRALSVVPPSLSRGGGGPQATCPLIWCLPLSDLTTSAPSLALGAPPRAVLLSRSASYSHPRLLQPLAPHPLTGTPRHSQPHRVRAGPEGIRRLGLRHG